ncbi:sigma-70 family RNA polymerase sigma factor [Planctomycetota bacterium]
MNTTHYEQQSVEQRRDALVVENLEFVRHILGRLTFNLPSSVDTENLEAAGVLGLVEAAQQFDESRGVPFKGFAYNRVRGAILDELRRNCPLSQQMLQQIATVRTVMDALDPPITTEILAEKTGMSKEAIESCMAAMRLTRIQSWDDSVCRTPLGGGSYADPQQNVFNRELKEVLADCIELLPRQERITITLYYMEDLRLKEIGEVLGLSESRISRILAGAQNRLKGMITAKTS